MKAVVHHIFQKLLAIQALDSSWQFSLFDQLARLTQVLMLALDNV
jgi:hypothetical protein